MRLHLLQAILLLILFPGMGLFAQSPAPQRLELPRYDKTPPNQLIASEFYPVGFSEKGKFAYAIVPADEACGCYFFEFRIQDLVTDKVLYRYDYSSDRGPEKDLYKNIEDVWKAKSAMFSREMKRYGIIQQAPAFYRLITDFSVNITPKEFSEPGLSDTKFIRSARVEVRNPERGKKSVAHLRFDNLYVKKMETIGVFKSPYEDRVALLVARIDRGWEGLPRVLDFEVIGVHQTKGYR